MIPTERILEFHAVVPQKELPDIPASLQQDWTVEDAARELVRGRMEVLGPVTAQQLADGFGLADTQVIEQALLALETEGRILRGQFNANPLIGTRRRTEPVTDPRSAIRDPRSSVPDPRSPILDPLEWCDRRLLARIHRYTLNRLRAEIEPVTPADFMHFLLHWQHVAGEDKVQGPDGVAAVIAQLDGYEAPAGAWEHDVLATRCVDYAPDYLDRLCLSGRVTWGRRTPMNGSGKVPLRSSPMSLMLRERAPVWTSVHADDPETLTSEAQDVLAALRKRGASFFDELVSATRLLRTQVERALAELAGAGLVTADSFSGLRALLVPANKRRTTRRGRLQYDVDTAGRWSLLNHGTTVDPRFPIPDPRETIARVLLDRYGVVFRSLLARESGLPPWRELVAVYRRLEARGEVRGGRFVKGFGGEQFALPDAVGRLRALRKQSRNGELIAISAADPLNLVGIVTPDARVSSITRNRILFRDGIAIAALEAGELRRLAECELSDETMRTLLSRRHVTGPLKAYLRNAETRDRWLARTRRSAITPEAPQTESA